MIKKLLDWAAGVACAVVMIAFIGTGVAAVTNTYSDWSFWPSEKGLMFGNTSAAPLIKHYHNGSVPCYVARDLGHDWSRDLGTAGYTAHHLEEKYILMMDAIDILIEVCYE